jgi:hypothetical protein
MGIKLDWQVESEQTQVHATDDPEARRRRRRAQRRLVLLVAGLAGTLALIAGLVIWRLQRVDHQLRQDLLDTVDIEVTALRLGDLANFMAIQRSASDTFLIEQSREFDYYQELKQNHRVQLTGKVLDATINDQRGRVILQEIIDGVPYKVVWFYWHYEDGAESGQGGWRRVPDDLTFWGDPAEIDTASVQISYDALDQELARALSDRLTNWWALGCAELGCATPPPSLHVEIVPERPGGSVTWSASDSWTLRITSPLVDRTRADVPLAPELERVIAQLVAGRLVRYAAGDPALAPYSDAAWLHNELADWLAGLALGDSSGSGFVNVLIAVYGSGVPRTILQALTPAATLDDVMTAVTGASMPLLGVGQLDALDWKSFFQWRLDLEWKLLSQPDSSGAFLALYDSDNVYAMGEAARRLEDPAYAAQPVPQVTTVTISRDAYSQTYAYVDTIRRMSDGTIINAGTVIWRATGGTWKRTS